MTDLNFGVRFTADSGGLRGEVRLTKEQLDRLRGSTDRMRESSQRLDRATVTLRDRWRSLNGAVVGLGGALRGLGVALAVREVTQAALEWDKYERTLVRLRAEIERGGRWARTVGR